MKEGLLTSEGLVGRMRQATRMELDEGGGALLPSTERRAPFIVTGNRGLKLGSDGIKDHAVACNILPS
jgi:hypothetical protein